MAGGATPTSSAGHPSAGANTTSKLTFKSDHQSGAGQCRPRCFAFLQILQHQLELIDLRVKLLRGSPELHTPQLGKLGLVLFDPQPSAGHFGPRHCQFCLALGQQGAKLGNLLNEVGSIRHQPSVYTRVIEQCRHRTSLSHYVAPLSRPPPEPKCDAARASRCLPTASIIALRSAPPIRPSPAARETGHAPAAWQ